MNNRKHKQKFDLPMGALISGVLAWLFPGFLESDPFKHIIANSYIYPRNIDIILYPLDTDPLVILYPLDTDLLVIMKLNMVERITEFAYEFEINNSLSFRDMLLIRNNDKLDF